jgi:hypothetical protein
VKLILTEDLDMNMLNILKGYQKVSEARKELFRSICKTVVEIWPTGKDSLQYDLKTKC